jgi:chitin synthase
MNRKAEGYALRQVLYEPPRKTELFIVMTMYNVRLLHSAMEVASVLTRYFNRLTRRTKSSLRAPCPAL